MSVHTYIHACIHSFIHTYIHSFIHTYMHTYMHTCMHTYIHSFIHSFIHLIIHSFIHTYILKCICTNIFLVNCYHFTIQRLLAKMACKSHDLAINKVDATTQLIYTGSKLGLVYSYCKLSRGYRDLFVLNMSSCLCTCAYRICY